MGVRLRVTLSWQNPTRLRSLRASRNADEADTCGPHRVVMTAGTSVVCLDCGLRGPTEQVEQYECAVTGSRRYCSSGFRRVSGIAAEMDDGKPVIENELDEPVRVLMHAGSVVQFVLRGLDT